MRYMVSSCYDTKRRQKEKAQETKSQPPYVQQHYVRFSYDKVAVANGLLFTIKVGDLGYNILPSFEP